LPDLAHAAFTEEGGDVIVPEAGAGAEGHELLSLLTGLVYAQAVNGSTVRRSMAPTRRTYARSEDPSPWTGWCGPWWERITAAGRLGADGEC
jgi:hypothetical protein